jgi:hypothetical protein
MLDRKTMYAYLALTFPVLDEIYTFAAIAFLRAFTVKS